MVRIERVKRKRQKTELKGEQNKVNEGMRKWIKKVSKCNESIIWFRIVGTRKEKGRSEKDKKVVQELSVQYKREEANANWSKK